MPTPKYVISAGKLVLIDTNVARHNRNLMMLTGGWHRPLIDWVLREGACWHLSHAIAKSLIKSGGGGDEVEDLTPAVLSNVWAPASYHRLASNSFGFGGMHTCTHSQTHTHIIIINKMSSTAVFCLINSNSNIYHPSFSWKKLSRSTCTHPSFTRLMERRSVYWRQICLLL